MKTFEIVVVSAAAVLGRAGAQLVTCPGFAGKLKSIMILIMNTNEIEVNIEFTQ